MDIHDDYSQMDFYDDHNKDELIEIDPETYVQEKEDQQLLDLINALPSHIKDILLQIILMYLKQDNT